MTARPPVPRSLYLLFAVSGMSGLIFEIVWVRALGRQLGTTAPAIATVVAAFMAGLALGNLLLGPRADRATRPLELYRRLELGIGASALLVSLALLRGAPLLEALARGIAALGPAGSLLRFGVIFSLLMIPTTLMGGTLPVMSRALARAGLQGRVVGGLYALNTAGAIAGALLPDLLFIPALGMTSTVALAAVGNLGVALGVGRIALSVPPPEAAASSRPPWTRPRVLALTLYGTSGLCAMIYQVVWSRVLQHWSSGLVISFSILLAVFLTFLALGSALSARWADRLDRPLAWAAVTLCATGPAAWLPLAFWPPGPSFFGLLHPGPEGQLRAGLAFVLKETLAQALFIEALPCLLMGATFPLLAAAVVRVGDTGRSTGLLYASNTLSGTAGALLGGFVLLPLLGGQQALLAGASISVAVALGCAILASARSPATAAEGVLREADPRRGRTDEPPRIGHTQGSDGADGGVEASAERPERNGGRAPRPGLPAAVAGGIAVIFLGAASLAQPERLARSYFEEPGVRIDVLREGPTTTAAKATRIILGQPTDLLLMTPGVVMSGTEFSAQRYMGLMAHLPLMLAERADDALLICYGLGNTARSLLSHPELKHLDVVDISPEVLSLSGEFASVHGGDPLADPRVTVHVDDGRQHLVTTSARYDVITLEPPPPAHAGIVNLYSREYYAAARARLTPDGALAQWLPVFLLDTEDIRAIVAAFVAEFDHAALYYGYGYQWILVGSPRPLSIDPQRWMDRAAEPRVAADLAKIGVDGAADLIAGFMVGGDALRAVGEGVRPLSDDFPIIQYPRRPLAQVEYPPGLLGDGTLGASLLRGPPPLALRGRLEAATTVSGLVQSVIPLLPTPDSEVRDLAVGRSIQRALHLQPGQESLLALVGVGREWVDPVLRSDDRAPVALGILARRAFFDERWSDALDLLPPPGRGMSAAQGWLLRAGAERALGRVDEARASFVHAAEASASPWFQQQSRSLAAAVDQPVDPALGPWEIRSP